MIPQVDYANITINHYQAGELETVAPTDPMLFKLDQVQAKFREGPCYQAATQQVHVICPNLGNDERFPNYGPAAVRLGIRSQAGLRLFENNRSRGALDLYSRSLGAFDNIDQLGALFTHQAAVAIGYASEIDNLNEAIRTRKVIGQAIGIVMERYQLNDERAFAFLTRLSQHRNVKLRLVAQEIIAASEHRGEDE